MIPLTRRTALRSAILAAGSALLPNFGCSLQDSREPSLDGLVNLPDFESRAKEKIAFPTYEFISGGSADERTLRWNREALDRIRLRPKVLVDVSAVDTRVTLFGQELPHPILLAPTAYHRLVHPEGELATVRGAGVAEATMVTSMTATTAMEEVARAATRPVWMQLYVPQDRGFTREFVRRAEAAGCRALCVTVDLPVIGTNDRERRSGFTLPDGIDLPNLRGLNLQGSGSSRARTARAMQRERLTWKDIEWLRSECGVPLLLKGVLNPDDADQAARLGISGLIVSNHGGRALDTVPASVDALRAVADKVADRIPLLVDGGIRRGTDVLKALALGARAVLIGRPYLYGLALGGAEGVARTVRILRTELEVALALSGRPSLASIDRSLLWP